MPRRGSSPAPSDESPSARLLDAVAELAGNVQVLTDIVEQIREDLSWLTRNGMPHQPLIVQVQRMPLVDSSQKGAFEFSLSALPSRDPTAATLTDEQLRTAVIDQVVDRLAEPIGVIAQEQLNQLLSVLDHSHRQVLQAIRSPQLLETIEPVSGRKSRRQKPAMKPDTPGAVPKAPDHPEPPPAPGQLF